MDLHHYLLYLVVASLTIASPGPGVVLSISNSILFGFRASVPGILGVSLGMFTISLIAASGVGSIVHASAIAFSILKYLGAAYLVYLGVKLWRSEGIGLKAVAPALSSQPTSTYKRFKEGLFITLSNPKPMVFFIALYPQFITKDVDYLPQFAILSITFCVLIILIHFGYALFAGKIRGWINNKSGSRIINRTSGLCFIGFALGLAINK